MSSFRQSRTLYRYSGGGRVKGSWVDGTKTTITILASIQALRGNELENNDTLRRRAGEVLKMYCNDDLNTLQNAEQPDRVLFNGKEFEIIMKANWQNNVISHKKYYIGEVTTK